MATDRATHLKKLERFLTCPLCETVITSTPKTLPCFHSFCTNCVNNNLNIIEHHGQECVACPQCGSVTPKDGFLPFNLMNDFVQLYTESINETRQCHCCEEEDCTRAFWHCVVCRINLCVRCKNFHEKTPNCKTHQYRACSEPSEIMLDTICYCSEHRDQVIDEYCTTCKKGICCKCKLSVHLRHPTEAMDHMLPKFVTMMKGPMRSMQSSVEALEDEEAYFKRELERIQKDYESAIIAYDSTRAMLLAQIERQYTTGRASLEDERTKNITKIETHMKQVTDKRKAKERLIDTTDILLTTSRACSLLEGLFGGILQKVTADVRQTNCLQKVKVKQPVHGKCDLVQGQEVSMGSVSFKESTLSLVYPWRIRDLEVNFEQVFRDFNGTTEVKELQGNPQRIAFIQDDIWIPSYDTTMGHQVLDMISNSMRSVKTEELNFIYAFHQTFKNEVIAACTNGLFSLTTEGVVKTKIAEGMFTDVTSVGNVMVAIEKRSSCVKQYQLDRGNRWILKGEFQLKSTSAHHETVHVLNNFIYVCFPSGKICKYTGKGKMVEEYGPNGGPDVSRFHGPYISGSDKSQSLIVCDSYNHKIQVRTPQGIWQELVVQGFLDYPRDLLVIRDCVFVLCGWFPRKLVKFSFSN